MNIYNKKMNLCVLTARLIRKPKLLFNSNNLIIEFLICMPINYKYLSWHNVKCKAQGEIAKNIIELYKEGDFIVIEGSIKIKKQIEYQENKKLPINKFIYIKIQKIHPTSLVFS